MATQSGRREGSIVLCLLIKTSLFIGLVIASFHCTNGYGLKGDISDGLRCGDGAVAIISSTRPSNRDSDSPTNCKSKKCYKNAASGQYICGKENTPPAETGEFPDGTTCDTGEPMKKPEEAQPVKKQKEGEPINDHAWLAKLMEKSCLSGKCYENKKTGQIICGSPTSGSIQSKKDPFISRSVTIALLCLWLYFCQPIF